MLTAGDIQFEPPQAKFAQLSNGIAAFIAGDTNAQTEILRYVQKRIPGTVEHAVTCYCKCQARYNLKQAENSVLRPYGLTMDTFLERERDLSPDFSDRIIRAIAGQQADITAIICGVDHDGGHIYVVDEYGRSSCHDSSGFAAIGDGEWHANSQFMINGYTSWWTFGQALLLTYMAKKKAEVAPGVGLATDLYYMWPSFAELPHEIHDGLQQIYTATQASQEEAMLGAHIEMQQMLDKKLAQAEPDEPETEASSKRKKNKSRKKKQG